MNIYTRSGDDGTTSLMGGQRVPKYHLRIEAYGTVDELIAYTGLIRDQDIQTNYKKALIYIQDRLMVCASHLASGNENDGDKLPQLQDSDITFLEKEIDHMHEHIPVLQSFILPGGHQVVSFCHIARCVCRRAERLAIQVSVNNSPIPLVTQFLNRLSDYFFVLARKLACDLKVEEIKWKPNLEK